MGQRFEPVHHQIGPGPQSLPRRTETQKGPRVERAPGPTALQLVPLFSCALKPGVGPVLPQGPKPALPVG